MKNSQRAYDHLVLCVNELEQAKDFYRQLGFTMTPVAVHPFGTHNSIAQLHGSFLEVLSVNDPSLIANHDTRTFSFPAFNRDFLEDHEGLAKIAFQGENAASDAAEFAAKGLSDFDTFDFSRKAGLPDGTEVRLSFSLAFVAHDDMPRSAFFTCHQHAPEYFWKTKYQSHENSAKTLVETMMVADEPTQYTNFFSKLLNSTGVSNDDGVLAFATNGGSFTLATPAQWQKRFAGEASPDLTKGPRLAGYTIGVDSLQKTTHCLNKNHIAYATSQTGIFISAATAHGCVTEFTQTT